MITVGILLTNVKGGGTFRHARELARAWLEDYRSILILIVDNIIEISVFQKGKVTESYCIYKDEEKLINILKMYGVQILHVEHLFNSSPFLLQLHEKLNIPLVITIHDYYMICPFINLTNENYYYCQEKGAVSCNECLRRRQFYSVTLGHWITNITEWRNFWEVYLKKAQLILVPSIDVKNRIQRYYPQLPIQVSENPEIISYHGTKRNIGLIGKLSIIKGARKLKDCLQYCVERQPSIHFILFGTLEGIELTELEKKYITVLGEYKESEIYSLIGQYFIDFFWFPSVCPETYSYTLSIPIQLHIPCIGTDLGAIGARIRNHHWGTTYSWKLDAEQIILKLEEFPYEKFYNSNFKITNTTFGTVEDYYGSVIGKIKEVNIEGNQNIMIDNIFSELKGILTGSEFILLWKKATLFQKIILLRHVDYEWLKKVLRQKGLKYFCGKILMNCKNK